MTIRAVTLLTALLFSGCMADYELTWRADPSVSSETLGIIRHSISLWEDSIDVSFRQVTKDPVITFQTIYLEYPKLGLNSHRSNVRFDAERQRWIQVLTKSVISLHTGVSQPGLQLRIINHEIGHLFVKADHTSACPSTMHPTVNSCGTVGIDSQAVRMANKNLRAGWLSKRADPIIETIEKIMFWW